MTFAAEVIRPLLKQTNNKKGIPSSDSGSQTPYSELPGWTPGRRAGWLPGGCVRSLSSVARPVRISGGLRLPLVASPAAAAPLLSRRWEILE